MNEIKLSTDLNVITAEINSYKQVAGQSIFEIGRRLKHVKENDLVHGEWSKWCESIGMNRTTAHRFIKTYEELPSNVDTWQHLSSRALYEIATLPQEEREKEHVTSKGETKTVDEMTVRELQEVKRQLNLEQKERERLEKENEKLANQEPIIQEKEVIKEIVPDNLKDRMESLERQLNFISKENDELRIENDSYKLKDSSDFDEEGAKKELKKLQNEADRNATQIRLSIKNLNNQIAVSKYMFDAISVSSDYEKQEMKKEIDILKEIIIGIEASLKNRRVMN